MRGTKRRDLTTDELMRMQEQPARKKFRPPTDDSEGNESADTSATTSQLISRGAQGSLQDEGGEEGSGSDVGEDGEEEDSGSDGEEDSAEGDEAESGEEESISLPTWDDGDTRFHSSRVSIAPRASKSTQTQIPKPVRTQPNSFEGLGISSALLNALAKMSIKAPTEIQAACIPPLVEGELRHTSAIDFVLIQYHKAETA